MDFQEVDRLLRITHHLTQLPHLPNIRAEVDRRLREIDKNQVEPKVKTKTEDEQKLTPQPKVPEPLPQTELSKMNNPSGTRIEEKKNEPAKKP